MARQIGRFLSHPINPAAIQYLPASIFEGGFQDFP